MEVGRGGGVTGKQEVVQCEWPLRGGGDDGEMGGGQRSPQGQPGDGALDWLRSLPEHQFSGSGEPLKVCEKGSDLISHLSGE